MGAEDCVEWMVKGVLEWVVALLSSTQRSAGAPGQSGGWASPKDMRHACAHGPNRPQWCSKVETPRATGLQTAVLVRRRKTLPPADDPWPTAAAADH